MPNRLLDETSPYLLQHAQNPVDWYPWSEDALARSRDEDKPIFLSIGYSACHWCHVMEHESFEDDQIAAAMNRDFVCIKVDREERPDLDQIYMNSVQLMTGRGGWPMSVFLTPDLRPFFGGTYWPPRPRMGMSGFQQILAAVATAWRDRREEIRETADQITAHLRQVAQAASESDVPPGSVVDEDLLVSTAQQLQAASDSRFGGFGEAPKFPQPMNLRVALRIWSRRQDSALLELVRLNLDKMSQGGIYDHLGGGFARYSVDQRWLVPHFEKMLYDNALLTVAYVEGIQATGQSRYARIARETCDYVLRDLADPQGGFHSSEDADSEGEEGKFYVWSLDEIIEVLGDAAGERFCKVYDVTPGGNFEGKNILNLRKPIADEAALRGWDLEELEAELQASRQALLQRRNQRVRPSKDDKILTNWNALMIEALCRAGTALDEPGYVAAAQQAATFLLTQLQREDGRLLHSWRLGRARFEAYLDDYAYLIQALTVLYESDFNERWVDHAVRLADLLVAHFADEKQGGFFYTADDHEALITRQKDVHDSSVPSGNGMAATALLRLARLCGRSDLASAAEGAFAAASQVLRQSPLAAGQFLIAADFQLGPTSEVALTGDLDGPDFHAALHELRTRFLPNQVVAARGASAPQRSPHLDPLFANRAQTEGLHVYVCQNFACAAPVEGKEAALRLWDQLAQRGVG